MHSTKSLPHIVSNPPSSSTTRVVLSSSGTSDQNNDSLPIINLHSTRPSQSKLLATQPIPSERGVVVGTKQLQSSSPKRSATNDEWEAWNRQQIVNPDDAQKSKLEWENEIARHILSVYASTNVTKNLTESQALLDFVADKQPRKPLVNDSEIPNHYPSFHEEHQTTSVKTSKPFSQLNAVQEEEAAKAQSQEVPRPEDTRPVKKLKKKKKLKPKTETDAPKPNPTNALIDDQFVQEFLARMEKHAFNTKEPDQYRVTNTIRARTGQTIVIRGNPRVYPIWFVPSGDIYANWTALPGGRKLQAHVVVLYEQGHYAEYLRLLEQVILTLWRERVYGREEFVVGSFGKDGASQPVSRTSTAQTARPRSSAPSSATRRNSSRAASPPLRGNWYEQILHEQINPKLHQQLAPHLMDAMQGQEGEEPGAPPGPHSLHLSVEPWFDPTPTTAPGTGHYNPLDTNKGLEQSKFIRSNTVKQTTSFQHTSSVAKSLLPTVQPAHETLLPPLDTLVAFWKQLILTCVAIGTLVLEKKQTDKGLEFFNLAEQWAGNDEVLTNAHDRRELRGYIKDGMAYYFLKRGKSVAALAYSNQALEIFERVENIDCIAACLLHISAVHCQLGEFKEAHRILFQFLAMIEDSEGRLAQQVSSPKQLCMVAIGYHNLAVIQLKLNMPDLACKSSQNARKLARLCLSYSNRWIDTFQYTHEVALSDMKYELTTKTIDQFTPQQQLLIKELATLLFQADANTGETL